MEAVAVGWGISIAGWIISPYITRLLDKAYDHLKPGNSREDLKNLMIHVIPRLRLTLQAAESDAVKKVLEGLVKELKSAFEDTEDILDELQYIQHDTLNWRRKRKLSVLLGAGPSNQSIGADHIPGPLRGRLKGNVEAIEKLIDKVRETLRIKNEAQSGSRSAEHGENATAKKTEKTSAHDAPRSVTGRDKVRGEIIQRLQTEDVNPSTSDDTCLSVIGIWGIPGSGKTTLAQYIVKSVKEEKEEKEEKYFNLVMWIHVSKSFSIHGIFKEMFELASKKDCPNYSSRDALVDALKGVLAGNRFLLVLDDIWYNENVHEHQELAKLLSPLMVGKRGSKILVTSRHENGVTELGPDVRIIDNSRIPELDDEVFLELFMHRAFGQNRRNITLMRIGSEIARKLKKSPLLAAAVGGMLCKSDSVEYWRNVDELKLLDSSDIMGPLWWCYRHLNEQAKRCFAYCSIFPRTHHLFRDELVNLWVAQGFISDTNGGWEMETFDELVSVSFLKAGGKDWNGKVYFIIHDLLYDIAEMVAGSDCFKIEDGMTKAPSDVRHLSVKSCNASMITEDIIKLGNLRTLIIFSGKDDMSEEVFDKMFRKLTKLRVLIYQASIKDDKISFSFPESIGKLRYLRYLGFHMTWVISNIELLQTDWEPRLRLPAKLAKLYLLQVLDLGVDRIDSVIFDFSAVKDMTNLTNLRHLMNVRKVDFPNIGRLTSLQTILPLRVSKGEGYGLEQLGNLNKLRGKLEIKGLESVKSKEEALAAKLADKKLLTELELRWMKWKPGRPTDVEADAQADVLEGLCPPVGLQHMKLDGYAGSRYPSWMVGPQKSTMLLKTLVLEWCVNKLPKTTNMEYLESLTFKGLEGGELPDDISLLTSLKRLVIDYCDNIHRLPALPTSLEYLEVRCCHRDFWKLCTPEGHQNWEEIKNIPNVFIELDPCYKNSYKREEYPWFFNLDRYGCIMLTHGRQNL